MQRNQASNRICQIDIADTYEHKHQELSEEIEEAQRGLATDDLHVTEMKKRKLKIKEEISRLQA